jgi:Nucleotidyltransferase of unknown function (DUF6036)
VSRRTPSAELLADLSRLLARERLRWYVFGARAAIYHGEARTTNDVDVTVEVPAKKLPRLIEQMSRSGFEPRVADAAAFAERARVVPFLHRRTKQQLDLVIAGTGLELDFLARAKRVDVGGARVPMISVEDLIVTKILAGRPRDIEDVARVAQVQGPALDLKRVRLLLGEIEAALERSDLLDRLERALRGD